MKNLKTIFIAFALIVGLNAFAGNEKVSIKTSAQCEMCKSNLETAVGNLEGVKKVLLNSDSKELIVKFDEEVLSLEDIKAEVNNAGYWADESAPNKDAYAALAACCKPSKSCCASKTSCSKGAVKTSCSKDASKSDAGTTEKAPATKSSCTGHTH